MAEQFGGLKPPGELQFEGNMEENWKVWHQQFTIFLVATEKTAKADKIKCALLLHCAGEKAIEVYNTFEFTDAEKDKYDPLVKKFEEHVKGKKDVAYERLLFNDRKQQQGESFTNFLTDLKTMAKRCEFETLADGLIRDRIIIGVRSPECRKKLINTKDLTLAKAILICKHEEVNVSRLKDMSLDDKKVQSVHEVASKPGKTQERSQSVRGRGQGRARGRSRGRSRGPRRGSFGRPQQGYFQEKCRNCGYLHHGRPCPAKGQSCRRCHGRDHFIKCCKAEVHTVNYDEYMVDDDDFVVDSVQSEKTEPWIVPIQVQNQVIPMKLDTGSDVNILPESDYQRLNKRPKLAPSKAKLTAYSGSNIPVTGQVVLSVKHNKTGQAKKALFIVCPGSSQPILGRQMCDDMGLVKRVLAIQSDTMDDPETTDPEFESLLDEYDDLFHGLGCMPGEVDIQLKPDAEPVIEACRKVPFGMYDAVEKELKKMEEQGVIAKITEPTDWVSSMHIVYKPDGSLRICLDPRNLNKAIKREHFKLPTREEIMSKMAGARYFSKIDARKGFWQIKLTKNAQKLCTFNTPFGRYCCLRLPFGISCAPEIYHRKMHEMLEGIKMVDSSMDDVVMWGCEPKPHIETIRQVFDECRKNNVTLNRPKTVLGASQLKFVGDVLSKDGLKPDPDKVKAITEMQKPSNKEDVSRFLGMIKYLARFLPELSTKSYHLRTLLKNNVAFTWGPEQDKSFQELKDLVSSDLVIQFYDPKLPIQIASDASMKGLGAILQQKHGEEWKPVAYASRSLTDTQSRYAPIEREALGIEFACLRFHQYIYGQSVEVVTDHKPLVAIFTKSLNDCPPRIQRMRLRLQQYDLSLKYVPGKYLYTADTLSRAALPDVMGNDKAGSIVSSYVDAVTVASALADIASEEEDSREHENEIEAHSQGVLRAMAVTDHRKEEIRKKYAQHPEMLDLEVTIMSGWPTDKKDCAASVQAYWNYRDEMSVQDGLILKGDRIVIPASMQADMLEKLHAGHLGQEKCKRRARGTIFWPGINRDIETMVAKCSICLDHRSKGPPEPLRAHEMPTKPWSKVGADLFTEKNKDHLVIVDYLSNYPDVYDLSSATSRAVIKAMKSSFARFGIPDQVVSDNGPCFASQEFATFAQDWNFEHVTTSPHYPRSNGMAEKTVKTVKLIYKKEKDPQLGLLAYRHAELNTGYTPAEVNLGRKVRSNLPTQGQQQLVSSEFLQRKAEDKEKQKYYHDRRGVRSMTPLKPGDQVRVYDQKNKWQERATVMEEISPRSYKVITDGGVQRRRNRSHLLFSQEPPRVKSDLEIELEALEEDPINSMDLPEPYSVVGPSPPMQSPGSVSQTTSPPKPVTIGPRRSARASKKPTRLIESM